ncbi:dihydrodipicolinate synthase family protein [Pendulispora albinea]|uniref:Dihydrodipicolinate synthase family protein n=1 Tax=Pendulispora albinea TaxID=2741071 RepID=A0ABZ2LZ91_9BACT
MFPALTTPFNPDLSIDHGRLFDHCRWLADYGVRGLVPLLAVTGEGTSLTPGEKRQVIETCMRAAGKRIPVIPAILAPITGEAVALAKHARAVGCRGLTVVAPYLPDVGADDWRETREHVSSVISATDLPCMLNNGSSLHGADFRPEQIAELAAAHPNLEAVKESSIDVRRISAIRALLGSRLQVLVGMDDVLVEGIGAGASGWVASLMNALPAESMHLYRSASSGLTNKAAELNDWLLPLLRMDSAPKFVQLAKLMQEKIGRGSARVRPPRLPLEGDELRRALETVERVLSERPRLGP